MKVAIYTRVSSDEQVDGFSLSAQSEHCTGYATQKGWQVIRVYEERGRSGKSTLRPEFQQMIRDAEAKQFDVIVVHKLDRFSRSLVDLLVYFGRLNELGVTLVSVSEDFDFTTPWGKLMLGVLGSVGQWYLDNLRTEITKGKKERARQGFWNGRLTWGYTTPKKLRAKLQQLGDDYKGGSVEQTEYSRQADLIENVLEECDNLNETTAVPCPFAAPGVRRAYELYATSVHSDQEVAKILFDEGYRVDGRKGNTIISKDMIEDVLQNKFYIGMTSYGRRVPGQKREWMPGNHKAIIDVDLFEKVQQVRKQRAARYSRGTRNQDKAVYPLTSMLVCLECGTYYQGMVNGGRRYVDIARNRRIGRTCHSPLKSVKADTLEEEMKAFLLGLKVPSNWYQLVLADQEESLPDPNAVERQRKVIAERLERLKKLFVMGDVSESEYLQMKQDLTHQLDALPVDNGVTMLDIKNVVELLNDLDVLLAEATPEELKIIFKSLFNKIYMRGRDIVAVEPIATLWALLKPTYVGDTGRTGTYPNNPQA